MVGGIYKIENIETGKLYVGSAKNFDKRRWGHFGKLKKGTHPNRHLQAAWNKDGADAFSFSIIEVVEGENLLDREQHWIDATLAAINGYNILPNAQSPIGRPGRKHSEATKEKIRAAATGRRASAETKMKISAAGVGRKHTAAQSAAITAAHIGAKRSDAARQKMSEAQKARYTKSPIVRDERGRIVPAPK